jgi:hypothetical protein
MMLEKIKQETRKRSSKKTKPRLLPPEVVAKLKSKGLDPETVTLKQLFL